MTFSEKKDLNSLNLIFKKTVQSCSNTPVHVTLLIREIEAYLYPKKAE